MIMKKNYKDRLIGEFYNPVNFCDAKTKSIIN